MKRLTSPATPRKPAGAGKADPEKFLAALDALTQFIEASAEAKEAKTRAERKAASGTVRVIYDGSKGGPSVIETDLLPIRLRGESRDAQMKRLILYIVEHGEPAEIRDLAKGFAEIATPSKKGRVGKRAKRAAVETSEP